MALVSRSTLYNWFKRRLKPLEEQFHSWIDSFWHKNDLIPTSAIDGLDAQLANIPTQEQIDAILALQPSLITVVGSSTFQMAAKSTIEYMVFELTAAGTVQIGSSAGANDIFEETYEAGHYMEVVFLSFQAAQTIHFTGNFEVTIKKG